MYFVKLNVVPILLFITSGYLAALGVDGWGWFLFVGLLCTSVPRSKKSD